MLLNCVQERTVRLFDRGKLNTYTDEMRFLFTVANCCRKAFPKSGSVDLGRYLSEYTSMLAEVEQLIVDVGTQSSHSSDAMFQHWSSLRDGLTSLVRRYVAARWLRRVLMCNKVAVESMRRVQCCVWDLSARWSWMRDFVNVL